MLVVPHSPGPLVRPPSAASRRRDELDELIDDVFPDTDERAGWFDAGLLAVGLALGGWAVLLDGPTAALVVGLIALALGCILPVRAAWRRASQGRRARQRESTLALGVPLEVSHPATARLARAYEELLATAGVDSDDVVAGHGALIESATLLQGRPPGGERELAYVEQRAAAIEELVAALREPVDVADEPVALMEAREELDAIGGFSSLSRLEQLIAEARTHRGHN